MILHFRYIACSFLFQESGFNIKPHSWTLHKYITDGFGRELVHTYAFSTLHPGSPHTQKKKMSLGMKL